MKRSRRRRYSEEFKQEAVRRVLDGSASSNQVSKELGIGQPTLSKWVQQFKQGGSAPQPVLADKTKKDNLFLFLQKRGVSL